MSALHRSLTWLCSTTPVEARLRVTRMMMTDVLIMI